MKPLLEVVCAIIDRIHSDNGVILNGPSATVSKLRFPAPIDSCYISLATEIIQFWGENLNELVTPDFYPDLVMGIREWSKWTKKMRHAKEWHIAEAKLAMRVAA